MTKNKKTVQLTLIFIGLILILATYYIYPKINKNKFIEQKLKEDKKIAIETSKNVSNTFENIKYNAFYNIKHPFTVQSEKAFILADEPDVVYMTSMKVTLHMKDGRVIVITSDKGSYNKVTYDCFLRHNVKATDGDTIIKGDNLDFLSNQEKVDIYNNVNLVNEKISMVADKINYNFEKKFYKISMFDDKSVNIKLIQ